MDTFTVAMTVLMAISALVQLVLSIATLSTKRRRAITNWIAWRLDAFTVVILLFFGGKGLLNFVLMTEPGRMDYYMMATSAVCIGMAYSVLLHSFATRYTYRVAARLNRLESIVLYSSEPSKEGPGG